MDPSGIEVREGGTVLVVCDNGVLTVDDQSVEPAGEISTSSADYDVEIVDAGGGVEYDPDPDAVNTSGIGTIGEATCIVRSSAYDNNYNISGGPILMTRSEIHLAWIWDGMKIRGLGQRYLGIFYRAGTGWRRNYNDYGIYPYARTFLGGYWVQQGIEGWSGFTHITGHYSHEHRLIAYVDRAGQCWGRDYFSGSLPGYGNSLHYMTVYRGAYEP